ncbi:dynamin like protein [Cavenderia fasciculata]|uniref:Dynamin like protein n=1 Tax=Cavenderia fasciculata TaxID=261658 RepID=F4Q2D1_CACFS|nr:dynamin like protein [Cavenderia fasciculata]EGG18151.1 dynamin like protein [Cavenderia fasciculata]|eukprot:XP_004366192.1 dynamin like protein [Cavenderia fasciculata]
MTGIDQSSSNNSVVGGATSHHQQQQKESPSLSLSTSSQPLNKESIFLGDASSSSLGGGGGSGGFNYTNLTKEQQQQIQKIISQQQQQVPATPTHQKQQHHQQNHHSTGDMINTNGGGNYNSHHHQQQQHLGSGGNSAGSPSHQLNKAQLAVAEANALKLLEEEKRKRDEKKRKRETDEQWSKVIRSKLELEKKKLDDDEQKSYTINQELYTIFNDLQMISHDHSIPFETPELVVVGMQSDGKSSFIESLLGFQFNIVESNIGTRRPLIIQMINNQSKQEPSCRFKKECHLIDGTSIGSLEDKWEEHETPAEELTEEIVRRTNDLTGARGDRVSSFPIFLRVEFAHCANLNIYDTPGFRKGGDERLKYEILDMVKKLIEPKHRIIVCLEQSNVEWANTISRPLIKKIDPDFTRTILINTKFDNRVKELRNRESAHKYLEGEGIVTGKKIFFISLPLKRNLDPYKFKEACKECYLEDYRKLLEIGFDENRFGAQIGIYKVKEYVERHLHERYQQNLVPSLTSLENICRRTDKEIERVRKELDENNLQTLKFKVLQYVQGFNSQIERLLEGSVVGDPDKYGQTLEKELEQCCVQTWPNFNFGFDIQNAKFALYGGAQFERLLNELEYVVHSREFPETSINEVASAIGISKLHNSPIYELAATNIFQIKSKKVLLPLIDIALQRCSYIFKRLFDIGVSILSNEEYHTVSLYASFLEEFKSQYFTFIKEIEADCKTRLKDDFDTFTKIVDWNLLNGLNEIKQYNYIKVTPEETKQRVVAIMESNPIDESFEINTKSRRIDEETYRKVCMIAGKLFSGIRFFFSKFMRNKLNAFFLDPLFQKLGSRMIDHFSKLTDQKYQELFQSIDQLKILLTKLESQAIDCKLNRDKFKDY